MKEALTLIPESVANTLGVTLMHSLWQLALVALLLIFALMFIPTRKARLRYNLGIGAMALMLALPFYTYFQVEADTPLASGISFSVSEEAQHAWNAGAITFAPEEATVSSWESFSTSVSTFFQTHSQAILALWLAGTLFFAIRFFGGLVYLQRLKGKYSQSVAGETYTLMQTIRTKMGIKKEIKLLESVKISSPMVVGALQPIILLPAGLARGISTQEMEYLLMHELAHIIRKDFLVNICQSIAEIVLFYHPATWIVSKLVRDERENCVDQMVVAMSGAKTGYARALLNLETMRQGNPVLAPAANGGQLFKRVKNIMGVKESRPGYSWGIAAVLIGLLVTVTLVSGFGDKVKAAVFPPQNDSTEVESPTEPTEEKTKTGLFNFSKDKVADKKDHTRFVLKSIESAVDTPKMVVTILDDGEEIQLMIDENGEIEEVLADGKPVSKAKQDEYAKLASKMYKGFATPPGPPAAPGDPRFDDDDHDYPPAPRHAHAPAPRDPDNPFAALGEGLGELLGGLGNMLADMPVFEKDGAFTNGMEELALNMKYLAEHTQDGEEPSPEVMEEFERRMERWGDQFENGFGRDMEAWGERMEEWGEEFERDFEAKFNEKDMEKWAEKFGKKFENNGKELEQWAEEFARKMERDADQIERDAEELERRAEELERQAEEMRRKADRTADLAERKADRIQNQVERIEDKLVDDGLINSPRNYTLKVTHRGMWVNGTRMPSEMHKNYKKYVERVMDIEIDKDNDFAITKN